MQDCWKRQHPPIWEERGIELPECDKPGRPHHHPRTTRSTSRRSGRPSSARTRRTHVGDVQGRSSLPASGTSHGRPQRRRRRRRLGPGQRRCRGAGRTSRSLQAREVHPQVLQARRPPCGRSWASTAARPRRRRCSSTRTRNVIAKVYQLSKGNPIEDTKDLIADLRRAGRGQGATLEILGVGTTGYAKDILKDVLRPMRRSWRRWRTARARCTSIDNVGRGLRRRRPGHQDHHPEERQGQGLQAQHAVLGGQRLLPAGHRAGLRLRRAEYADIAFKAESMPMFGYGCAVFMQSDIVDFQRQGWAPERDHGGPGQRAAQEHLAVRQPDPQPGQARHAVSSCRAAPSATWPR